MQYDYTWEDIADSVLNMPNIEDSLKYQGEFKRLSITMYSDKVPIVGDIVLIAGIFFICKGHYDVTTTQEYEEGLSYSKVCFESCE